MSRREGDEVQAFRGTAPQLTIRMRHQRGAVAQRAQAEHRDEHLVLAAAPGSGRVDVQRKHVAQRSEEEGVPAVRVCCCSSQSFANLSST